MKRRGEEQECLPQRSSSSSLAWLSDSYLEAFKRKRREQSCVQSELQSLLLAPLAQPAVVRSPAASHVRADCWHLVQHKLREEDRSAYDCTRLERGSRDRSEEPSTPQERLPTGLLNRGSSPTVTERLRSLPDVLEVFGRNTSSEEQRQTGGDIAQDGKRCSLGTEGDVAAGQAFQCTICRTVFTKRWHAEDHVRRLHFDARPYSCAECGARFKQKSSMESHVNVVHRKLRPFVCRVCQKAFGKKNNLKMHLIEVHGEKGL
mmetsp:Transcript_7112/g.19049  ORF Transcript_7112/g.19049 Transcript_7112/m.19049 type:complete len:261 (+) Transcript_7112:261-1043(+)